MSAIFDSIITGSFTAASYLICLLAAFLCGILTAASSSYRSHASKSFIISLIVLPPIVSTVITMVNGNIGTGVAVMGAFSLVRFRSVPGKAKDIASIFTSMTAGLACASGYVGIAVLFSLILCVSMIILASISVGDEKSMDLRITVPESLCFANEFDDIFARYTKKHHLIMTKTTNMGSLYKLLYRIEMKDKALMQNFIDELRCRNGNLEIAVCESAEVGDEL